MDLNRNHFDNYNYICEYVSLNMIIIMTEGNYDYCNHIEIIN